MAAAKFFKKPSPADPVILANGQSLKFNTLDYKIGFFATESESLATELTGYINQQRFGLSEVSWAEYDAEYLKKKNGRPSRRLWREELSHTGLKQNPFLELNAGPAAAGNNAKTIPIRMAETEAVVAPEKPAGSKPEQSSFTPTVGRR